MTVLEGCLSSSVKFTVILDERHTFDEALALCAEVPGRTLARVSSKEENDFLDELFEFAGYGTGGFLGLSSQYFWLG